MTFGELKVGDVFFFEAERLGWVGCFGPWRKVSARKYVRFDDGMECRVGSVRAKVLIEVV